LPSLGIRFSVKGTKLFALNFGTRALPCFVDLYNKFYVDNIKVVPKNIFEILTPLALAH
jgi:hypothetical protein